MEASLQLGVTIQAQSLAKVVGNLMEHGTSIEKIADVQGAGFAQVDNDLDLMGKRVNMVKVDMDSLDESMKSILERLEILEKQNMAKDKLICNLNCCVTKLSEALGQRSGGEDIHKVSSGSGSKEDLFELEVDEEETWDDCPQGESPEEKEVTGSDGDLESIVPCSEAAKREAEEGDVLMEESENEGRGWSSHSVGGAPQLVNPASVSSLPLVPMVEEEKGVTALDFHKPFSLILFLSLDLI